MSTRWNLTLRIAISTIALAIAILHVFFPQIEIDSITLVLLGIVLVPWLAPLFKSIELPGGLKIEFSEFQKTAEKAESAGLLSPETATTTEFAFQEIAERDANLALAGLRIELEKRLNQIAEAHGIAVPRRGISYTLKLLANQQILNPQEMSALADMIGLLNNAVHGAEVDQRAATWAFNIGPRLLNGLDARIKQ